MTMVRTAQHKLVVAHGIEQGRTVRFGRQTPLKRTTCGRRLTHQTLKLDLYQRLADRMAWTVDPLPPRVSNW